jgi:hypothetical protein
MGVCFNGQWPVPPSPKGARGLIHPVGFFKILLSGRRAEQTIAMDLMIQSTQTNLTPLPLTVSQWALLFFLAMLLFPRPVISAEFEFSGYGLGEARIFANSAIHPGQEDHSASFAIQPEFYYELEDGSSFLFTPFYRVDSTDKERTHFDVRELSYLGLFDNFEVRAGVRKVFWGTTEILHLVDIINQTDLVENIDSEDKLGQPMLNLSTARDWGILDLFILPYFRERTFAGRSGRLRGQAIVDTDQVRYESAAEEWHTDWAIRYSQVFGDVDLGLYHFYGTSREPTLVPGTDGDGNLVFIPFYEQMNQTGLDLSYVTGEWLWKTEALYRTGQGADDYFAWTGGFEYTFTRAFESAMDIGVVLEGMYDGRGNDATTPFENDIGLGLRIALNDAASTEALFGLVQDVGTDARSLFLEANQRFGDNWKLSLELRAFLSQPESDLLFGQHDDDLLQVELFYYF